ncbi:hypothetical protein [Thermosipho sp. (in: thermotogales)]|jgi:hypothetical protein|uniref:hypothetical protein n=1 Tax=Thermosipho sp. (in: thermotogales) TaxID=1968895 RepID=UPI00257A7C36|nr:hypothetical protein [Thermosipho sp. (in: thermotogales)]MBZ4649284.1 hypothetical protein [Thermosipho sp. (in: thermotogales)]
MKIIIGGGISGLIFKFYNPEYKIVSSNVGGQMTNKIPLGPRILQVNEWNERLLKDLGIECNIKKARIGYFFKGKLHDFCPDEYRILYYMKSRCLANINEIPESVMSEGKNEILYYDVNFKDIIQKILSNIKICHLTVKQIKHDVISFFDVSTRIKYEHIVSTIPAPTFCMIYGNDIKEVKKYIDIRRQLRFLNKQFVLVDKKYVAEELGDFDYVYFPENKQPYNRITKVNDQLAVVEFTNVKKNKAPIFSDIKGYEYIDIGQIQGGVIQEPDKIMFLGRYAEWNHKIKTQDIVKKSIEFRNNKGDENNDNRRQME